MRPFGEGIQAARLVGGILEDDLEVIVEDGVQIDELQRCRRRLSSV